jgi:CRP-like cAMP-binding protein
MRPPSSYIREVEALAQLEFSRYFDRLTLQQLAGYVALNTFTRRSVIYRMGEDRDAVYGLVSGHVKLTREDAQGARVLLEILPPGTVFGEDALFAAGRRERTALAHDMVMVARLGRADMLPSDWGTAVARRRTHLRPLAGWNRQPSGQGVT